MDVQDQCTVEAVRIAGKMGLPLVATADAHYLCQDDALAHDVLVCINTGKKRSDQNRKRYGDGSRFPNPYYVRSPEDMYRLFPEQAEAVRCSQEIADKVHIEIDFKKRHFPVFTPPKKKTPEAYLEELCLDGVKLRYGDKPSKGSAEPSRPRAGHHLQDGFRQLLLGRLGLRSLRNRKWHPVQPPAAPGCGAIVSYVLRLSHVDPLAI